MKKFLLSLITVLLVGFIFNSCQFPELPDPEITISQDFMSHVAVVNFITDTSAEASGTLEESLDQTVVTITGPDASKVYNIEGTKDFKITGGMVALLLDPSADFVANNEYNINLVVEPAGYLKRIIPIKFIKDQNENSYEVAMLKKSSMPDGITMATNTAGVVTATGLTTAFDLTASNTATNGVTTTITVPAGIKMKDVNNTALTGKLETEVISFTETGDNTAYFPGGLNPEKIDMGNGTTASGAFVSAGFASINMTVGGKKVKTFEDAKVAVKMTLSKDNFNPLTEEPYKEDDTVDVWSYDEDKGIWKFEKKGIVKKDASNALYVDFETSHLSSFNLDCLFSGADGRCFGDFSWDINKTNRITFNWTANVASIDARVVFTTYATFAGGALSGSWGQYFRSYDETISKGDVSYIYNAPRTTTKMDVYDRSSGKLLLTKIFAKSALCANPSVTLNVPSPPSPTRVTLKYQAMCPNKTTKILPPVGTTIYYKQTGTTSWRSFFRVTVSNRSQTSLTTNLLNVGKTYDFKVVVGNKKTEKTYTITSANYFIDVPLPDRICNTFK